VKAVYLDSSAITKLAVGEPESVALLAAVDGMQLISSRVAVVEVTKAVGRLSSGVDAALILSRFSFVELDADLAAEAAHAGGPMLRALDAIHLASALLLEGEIEAFITYDARQAVAAQDSGLVVISPGAAGPLGEGPDLRGSARHRLTEDGAFYGTGESWEVDQTPGWALVDVQEDHRTGRITRGS
jgi:uncharacterized protein